MKTRFKKEKQINCNKDGSEKICSKPTELRTKLLNPVSLREKMKSLWSEFRLKDAESKSQETIQDAQDFDVDNDQFIQSPYEVDSELHEALEEQEIQQKHAESSQLSSDNESEDSKEEKNDA